MVFSQLFDFIVGCFTLICKHQLLYTTQIVEQYLQVSMLIYCLCTGFAMEIQDQQFRNIEEGSLTDILIRTYQQF